MMVAAASRTRIYKELPLLLDLKLIANFFSGGVDTTRRI